MPKVAVSIGDINGISIEIALRAHNHIKEYAEPLYIVDRAILEEAVSLLGIAIPKDFEILELKRGVKLEPKMVTKESGAYSFDSFTKAIELADKKLVDFIVTLPISKEAWGRAGLEYRGHTDFFRKHYKKDAIMILGTKELRVALFTEHIALKDVSQMVKRENIYNFLLNLYNALRLEPIGVLALNPHGGDGGVLGSEDVEIEDAIKEVNRSLGSEVFFGPLVPDIAFIPKNRERFKLFVAIYHDQGLAPLKALYFEESINTTLNIPITRHSPDHGCAYDIAYSGANVSLLSYINCFKAGI